jgi:pimeloyl-ACP methyl ester carboxylesterase
MNAVNRDPMVPFGPDHDELRPSGSAAPSPSSRRRPRRRMTAAVSRPSWERVSWPDHVREERLSCGEVRLVEMGTGTPLVLLHGLAGNWQSWLANLSALSAHHRVIAIDLPGFGHSALCTGAITMEGYADTVVELLDRLGIDRATLIGNSMGGLITIEAAARHPERIAAAILVCSGGIPLTGWRHRLVVIPLLLTLHNLLRHVGLRRWALARPWRMRLLAGGIVHRPREVPAPLLSEALSGLGAPGVTAALRAGLGYDARRRAPRLTCPTLLLWGREDRVVPLWMGEELHALIPHSRLVVWDGVGHCPMLEAPERFDELVESFVAQTAPSEHSTAVGRPSR